jgi:hypothetical protein
MIEQVPAYLAAGALAAVAFTWFAESVTLHLLGVRSWRVALLRGLGLAQLSLVALVLLRLFLPDLFVPPLIFLAVLAVDFLIDRRSTSTSRRLGRSVVVSMIAVGALLLVDGALHLSGNRLALGL